MTGISHSMFSNNFNSLTAYYFDVLKCDIMLVFYLCSHSRYIKKCTERTLFLPLLKVINSINKTATTNFKETQYLQFFIGRRSDILELVKRCQLECFFSFPPSFPPFFFLSSPLSFTLYVHEYAWMSCMYAQTHTHTHAHRSQCQLTDLSLSSLCDK